MTPRLCGAVHLGPLPGSPTFGGDLDRVIGEAADDAKILAAAGFDAVIVENFGNAPFYTDDVPKVTVAAMALAVSAVREAASLPFGVNVLRNDALGALAIAAATGAAFIRVNVLSGTMFTDQGPIVGQAAAVARERAALAPDTAILADVFVKHAVPPPGLDLEQAAADLAERAGADAVIVTGRGTGAAAALEDVRRVRAVTGDTPVLVGSGVDTATVADVLAVADGVIVGTAVKAGGITTNRVDPGRAAAFVEAAGR